MNAYLLALKRQKSIPVMTLEELIRNHELAKANAARAESADERETYFDLVAYYAKRIREAQGGDGGYVADWSPDAPS